MLLGISSLPSAYGIGCFDKAAYDFVDWLAEAGQTYWQILPVGATGHENAYDSPYQAFSAFAGNPYYISLEDLIEEGVLSEESCKSTPMGNQQDAVDYDTLFANRLTLLHKAYEASNISCVAEYQQFLQDNNWWLEDYALFMSVRQFFGNNPWYAWPEDIRMHYGYALDYYRQTLYFDVEFHKYLQFKFSQQWKRLKEYANKRGIRIIGDIPIYVSLDSADVWAHPELFQLDERNLPTQIAGCPPDSFCADGQVWGNPLYNWEYHKSSGYHWWVTRMWYSFQLYDVVRIDHFRGFDAYFSIPADSRLAAEGHWEKGPGMELFHTLKAQLGDRDIIAEDLGFMTDTVKNLVRDSGFPNMKVLQFAFAEDDVMGNNDHLPHNYIPNCVVYTGTHDNDTLYGWFRSLTKGEKGAVRRYLGDEKTADKQMYWKLIQLALMSCGKICIIPMQDWLGLDSSARMNRPGTVGENWRWRMVSGQLTQELKERILMLTMRYGRVKE